MPEEDWAEVVQGVPAKDETFIKQYLGGREALIAQEKKQRSGKPTLIAPSIWDIPLLPKNSKQIFFPPI